MHRRDFLLGGVKVGLSFLLLDSLSLPAFARQGGEGARGRAPFSRNDLTRLPDHLDDSLNVIAAYLAQYAPPEGHFPADGAWKARYDLIEWMGTPTGEGAIFSRSNRLLGHLAVTRRPGSAGAGVGYDLDHAITINGFESTLVATMQCSGGRLPGLMTWATDYEMYARKRRGSAMRLSERGRLQDGVLEIASAAGSRRFETDRPVLPQWAVLDALRGARADSAGSDAQLEFDLLHDLTSYRPHQRLVPCGVLDINLGGRAQTLHGFVQTGWGSQPTHYWVDSAGRPLLVTAGLLASGLTSIQPA